MVYVGFYGSLEVLSDTFAIEDVVTFRLDGIFGDVVTDSANSGFAIIGDEL